MKRSFFAIVGVIGLALVVLNSCEVIVDFGLKDATYELYEARIPGEFEGNALHLMLPGYVENDPAYRYIIHFYDNDRCTGTYYAADTVNYEVEGSWHFGARADFFDLSGEETAKGHIEIPPISMVVLFQK